ncbi:MFS transporter [Geomicrobium sp. JCM 19055]|uniref:MFS transporter n=1 Tax=Geomicrobium sp. JCM 19055 TaxID=1460649 RepID=UPI00045ED50A|nr:MFS transporter [Geomicrobium sp. JCM 19055]GAK00673.1 permease [Geomicrobium sp. JCM 19055]
MLFIQVYTGFSRLSCFFSERFNQSPASASLVLSLTTIAIAFSLLLAPLVSNELGRKRTMVLALVLTSSLNSISLIVDNFYWLLLIRLLIGICISGFLASVITYLKEEVERNKLGMVVGIYVGGTALGGVLARIISSSMIGYVELNTLAFIIGIVTMLASIFFWLLLPSSKHFIKRKYSIRNLGTGFIECLLNKRILSIYICTFFTIGIYTSVLNYISYPLAEPPFLLNQSFIGLIYIATLSGVIGSILFGRFVERVFDISLYRIALTIMTVGVILTTSSFFMACNYWIAVTCFWYICKQYHCEQLDCE